ncbi:pyruvate, phosphate dikinase [Acidobacteriota bacterium]
MTTEKYVYFFGGNLAEGNAGMKSLLGGKGANLAEMTNLGIRVPPGFTITTEVCNLFDPKKRELPEGTWSQVEEDLESLSGLLGRTFGDKEKPFFLSVRSGAAISMPGMMDTVLNIGLNEEILEGFIKATGNPRLGYDAWRRLVQMFGNVVMGIADEKFEAKLKAKRESRNVETDVALDADAFKELAEEFLAVVKEETGRDFPREPRTQLRMAIEAVFLSWNTPRAIQYRRLNDIPETLGTAVNVQTMVFGNTGENSFSGVAFTRNPATGEDKLYGEYLQKAQGEDVVAGVRTPEPIDNLKNVHPDLYDEFAEIAKKLEVHYKDVQDIEFTIEDGVLYILQTRSGKRTTAAAVKTAVDMVKEGLIITDEALARVNAKELDQLLHPRIDESAGVEPAAKGLNASPGAASGRVFFNVEETVRRGTVGEDIILVREDTTADDVEGMFFSRGILTARGGMTSHAAVVARGMGRPCVSGCADIELDPDGKWCTIAGQRVNEGDLLTIDGTTGEVYIGKVPTMEPEISEEFEVLLRWADQVRRLKVMANADTPEGSRLARRFGCQGIGLCRTERMFGAADRIVIVQKMILTESIDERQKYLDQLMEFQKSDFKSIFKIMDGLPVTVRLLDPPLHEFLPPIENILKTIIELNEQNAPENEIEEQEKLLEQVKQLTEVNPMLGHRGVRMGLSFPEIYKMQLFAMFYAYAELLKEGVDVHLEVMVPQVCTSEELKWVHGLAKECAKEVENATHIAPKFQFGTMIEVVRACMRAGRLAEVTDFFSFGTNDLSQATFSFSREDAEKKFLPLYNERGILQHNPFQILDVKGVGRLMMIAVEWGRKTKPELVIGICGEHGGEPDSVDFCHRIGLTYVSCSPYRLPTARLAAAQAVLRERQDD